MVLLHNGKWYNSAKKTQHKTFLEVVICVCVCVCLFTVLFTRKAPLVTRMRKKKAKGEVHTLVSFSPHKLAIAWRCVNGGLVAESLKCSDVELSISTGISKVSIAISDSHRCGFGRHFLVSVPPAWCQKLGSLDTLADVGKYGTFSKELQNGNPWASGTVHRLGFFWKSSHRRRS